VLLQQSIEHVSIVHMQHLLCNALVHLIYSRVSGQCSHSIHDLEISNCIVICSPCFRMAKDKQLYTWLVRMDTCLWVTCLFIKLSHTVKNSHKNKYTEERDPYCCIQIGRELFFKKWILWNVLFLFNLMKEKS